MFGMVADFCCVFALATFFCCDVVVNRYMLGIANARGVCWRARAIFCFLCHCERKRSNLAFLNARHVRLPRSLCSLAMTKGVRLKSHLQILSLFLVIVSKAKQSNGMESFMILGFLARCLPRSHVVLARNDVPLCHCEQGEAINRRRILMILASHTVGCRARVARSQ